MCYVAQDNICPHNFHNKDCYKIEDYTNPNLNPFDCNRQCPSVIIEVPIALATRNFYYPDHLRQW